MYQRCKLVHGDLSEYNLLWHNNQIYVIDVSQSVETDHPSAIDFLRKDASNVNDYFDKVGKLDVMSTRQLFDFITTVVAGDSNDDEAEIVYLDRVMNEVEESRRILALQSDNERRENQQQNAVDEAVFMSSFLPRSLNQVADYDVRQIEKGEVEETYAHAVAALTGNHHVVDKYRNYERGEGVTTKSAEGDLSEDGVNPADGDDDSGSSDDEESDFEGEDQFVKVSKTSEELDADRSAVKAQRKANKKAVREAKTEKRQTKIKKKDKKRAIKKAKAGNRKT